MRRSAGAIANLFMEKVLYENEVWFATKESRVGGSFASFEALLDVICQ